MQKEQNIKTNEHATKKIAMSKKKNNEIAKIEFSIDRFLVNYQFNFFEFKKRFCNVEK